MKKIIVIITTIDTVWYTCMLLFLSTDIRALPMPFMTLSIFVAICGYICLGNVWIKLWKMSRKKSDV